MVTKRKAKEKIKLCEDWLSIGGLLLLSALPKLYIGVDDVDQYLKHQHICMCSSPLHHTPPMPASIRCWVPNPDCERPLHTEYCQWLIITFCPPTWDQGSQVPHCVALLVKLKKSSGSESLSWDPWCRIKDAEENLGESEVRDAYLARALFYIRIGDKVRPTLQIVRVKGQQSGILGLFIVLW